MSYFASMSDGLRNLVSGLGTGRDKGAASEYVCVQLTAQQLVTAYDASESVSYTHLRAHET